MTQNIITLPSFYFRQISLLLDQQAAETRLTNSLSDTWLNQYLSQKQRTELLHNPTVTLSFECLNRLLMQAITISKEPLLGVLLGQQLTINTHGVLGFAAMNSHSVEELLTLLERFIGLRLPLVTLEHQVNGEHLVLMFTPNMPLGECKSFILEAVMAAVHHVFVFLTQNTCPLTKVIFPFQKPESKIKAEHYFHCSVIYDNDNTQPSACFVWPKTMLTKTLSCHDPASYAEAVSMCQKELDKLTEQQKLSQKLHAYLLSRHTVFPSLNDCANFFNLTPRTLHRRLQDEASAYRKIVESVRETLAIEHLKAGRLTIQEVAYVLGYSDQANFRRAFKRWQNISPSAFRQKHGIH